MTMVAQTILEQLGGNKFVAMTGAHTFIFSGSTLRFTLPRGAANKANLVRVTLEGNDTYTVAFLNYRKLTERDISEHAMVHADGLQHLFKAQTGFDTYL